MSELYYVAGLPRSGATMMINILKQNPKIHGEAVSSVYSIFNYMHYNWDSIANIEYKEVESKIDVLKAILYNYHARHNKEIIFDKDLMWVTKISILEALLKKKIKILCPVRNPIEIISSFERIKRNNPLSVTMTDDINPMEATTIASRAHYFANPEGSLGKTYTYIKDAVTMGYLDRMLFIDYNKFCNAPKNELNRVYDFFELPSFEHDFENIEQNEVYDDSIRKLPNLHKIKPKLEKSVIDHAEYLGRDVYQRFNREIFWNEWI
jgi:sulfotransferase